MAVADGVGGMPPLTDIIAAFVVDTPRGAAPARAVETAKLHILDTLGVALAAADSDIGRMVGRHAAAMGGVPAATIFGMTMRTSPALAALANGTLANALDYDEGIHIATHNLPAALAAAEWVRSSGADLLDAFVIGHEVAARVTEAIDGRRGNLRGGPTRRGWWHVGLVGPLASAATVARLLGLDRSAAATAIGIASCHAGGFRRNMGTMAKALHSGIAARAGVESVLLARQGFNADSAILESPLGFIEAVSVSDDRDLAAVADRLGRPFTLGASPQVKVFPACTPAHSMIDAALAIRGRGGFDIERVHSVEADLHPFSLLRPEARDENAAGFSGAYLVAAALVHGTVGLDQIAPEAVHDPRVRALMTRIVHRPRRDPNVDRVAVHMTTGAVLDAEVPVHPRRLVTEEDISEKFRDCARRVLSTGATESVRDCVLNLEQESDMGRLMLAVAGDKR